KTFASVVDAINAGQVRGESLRRTDIWGRLLAPDVLLPGLKRHAVGAVPVRIYRHTDNPSGRLAHVFLPCRKKRRVRAAIPERHAKALRVAEDDICAQLAGRRQERQAEKVGADSHEDARALRPGNELTQIVNGACFVRRLHQRAKYATAKLLAEERIRGDHDQLDTQRFRSGPQDINSLRETAVRNEKLR